MKPGTRTPRTKPPEKRRTDLLDAAESLVLERGADGFTIEDVTVGAGVAKGTFYLHFSSKGDLLDGLRERYVRRFADAQLAHARRESGVAAIRAWMRAGVAAYRDDVRLHDILFHPAARGERDVPNAVVDTLADLLAELDDPPADTETTAFILYAALHGVADHLMHVPDLADRMLRGLDDLVVAMLS